MKDRLPGTISSIGNPFTSSTESFADDNLRVVDGAVLAGAKAVARVAVTTRRHACLNNIVKFPWFKNTESSTPSASLPSFIDGKTVSRERLGKGVSKLVVLSSHQNPGSEDLESIFSTFDT
jgi:hypothetical protein